MAGKDDGPRIRQELDNTRIAQDEEDVQKVINTVNAIANPFEETETALLHLITPIIWSSCRKGYFVRFDEGQRYWRRNVSGFLQKSTSSNDRQFFRTP